MADSKSLKRIKVTVSEKGEKDIQILSEKLGMTPAAVRALALKTGIERLKSGDECAPSISFHGNPENDDLNARMDDLEARVSGLSEALSGTLTILSWVVSKQVAAEQEEDDREEC